MPNFTSEEVVRLARLARLDLTDDERTTFTEQLGAMLAFVQQVQAVASTGGDSGPPALASSLREDEVAPSLGREQVFAAAPGADPGAGLFKVPRVIERS